jgi:tRNA dimethylallyltransferase
VTAVELIKQNTRRYAKRQMTWFRKYGNWQIYSPDDYETISQDIEKQIHDKKYTQK